MKKSWLLVVITLIIFNSISFAKTFKDVENTKYETAVNALVEREVINGFEDDTFRPYNEVTRAQLAKMIVTSLNLKAKASTRTRDHFEDVEKTHWAYNYILVASDNDIITGYGDGNFKPEKSVSYIESMTMIIRAMGYEKKMSSTSWPNSYIKAAKIIGIDENIFYRDITENATRGNISIELYNMLEVLYSAKFYNYMIEIPEDEPQTITTNNKSGDVSGEAIENPSNNNSQKNNEKVNKDVEGYDLVSKVSGMGSLSYINLQESLAKYEVSSIKGKSDVSSSDVISLEGKIVKYKLDGAKLEIINYFSSDTINNDNVVKSFSNGVISFEQENDFDVMTDENKKSFTDTTVLLVYTELDDDNNVRFRKVSNLGNGADAIKCEKEDRIVFDRINNTMFIIRGLSRKDNISNGVRISISLDKAYGIVQSAYSNKVKINDRQYQINDNKFIEDSFALVSYDTPEDSEDEIKLVAQYEKKILDNEVSVVSENGTGKIKYTNDESYDFAKNQNKLKDYVFFEIETSVKNGEVSFTKCAQIKDIITYNFVEGDRIHQDDSTKIIIVIKGLDKLDIFENGVFTKHSDSKKR